jgi:hypothetical protein
MSDSRGGTFYVKDKRGPIHESDLTAEDRIAFGLALPVVPVTPEPAAPVPVTEEHSDV